MTKERDTHRAARPTHGVRDELPGPTPGSAEDELDRELQSRRSPPGPTTTSKAEGDLYPEDRDRPGDRRG
jgi:hypothetical protein